MVRLVRLRWQVGAAFTVWPVAIFHKHADIGEAIMAHEMVHWRDQRRWPGVWWLAYFALVPRYGMGRKHPMEREGYRVQDETR